MYIAPNSSVIILSGIPLDSNYNNTLFWNSITDQVNYFSSKRLIGFDRVSYVRENAGIVRVEANASTLYPANYMMFRNTSYTSKWFFAFITKVEYINDSTSQIYFEIDAIQTWFFEMELEQCFIERQHAESDVIGENLIPDNIEKGEYVIDSFFKSTAFSDCTIGADGHMPDGWTINMLCPYDGVGTPVNGGAVGNIFNGLKISHYKSIQEINTVINNLTEKNYQDTIVCIYMAPENFQEPISGFNPRKETYQVTIPTSSIDGYAPKNNKLFTYPYCFLGVTNFRGGFAEYRYEYFGRSEGAIAKFEIAGTDLPDAEFSCAPYDYKGVDGVNYNEVITLTGLPSCSYGTDYYKAWLAQRNQVSNNLQLASGLGGLVGSIALMSNPVTSAVGAVGGVTSAMSSAGQIAQAINEREKAKNMPDQIHGQQQSSIMYSLNNFNFGFIKFNITYQFARIIDEYWTMFGYPIHRVKKPNINARENFTYVKTINASVTGRLPNDDRVTIERCLDNGITFWKNPNNVGNYNVSNGVL